MTKMLELANKDFKAATIAMFIEVNGKGKW